MPTLVSFYRELAKRAPYITITDCNIVVRATRGGRGGAGFGGAVGTAGGAGGFRNGVAAVVQNQGNGVTDNGGPAGGGGGGRRGGALAATDPNALQQGGRRGGNAQPVLPGNMNVTFDLTAVEIIHPGVPAVGGKPAVAAPGAPTAAAKS